MLPFAGGPKSNDNSALLAAVRKRHERRAAHKEAFEKYVQHLSALKGITIAIEKAKKMTTGGEVTMLAMRREKIMKQTESLRNASLNIMKEFMAADEEVILQTEIDKIQSERQSIDDMKSPKIVGDDNDGDI